MSDGKRKAARLFKRFTGHDPVQVGKIAVPSMPSEGVAIGFILDIAYETVRNGKVERYRHTFSKHARPLLVVSPDGRQILMLGGAFRFTERGIVDSPKR